MSSGASVKVDTSRLERDSKQLAKDIERDVNPAADKTAGTVQSRLYALVPVDTGALRDTVQAESIKNGAQVHYGGDLEYAGFIVNRTHCTHRALTGAERLFQQAMRKVAAQGVSRV